jgi:hypothetical protein
MRPAEGECAAAAHIARPRFNLTNYMLCNKKLWMRAFYFARRNKNKKLSHIYVRGRLLAFKMHTSGRCKKFVLVTGDTQLMGVAAECE